MHFLLLVAVQAFAAKTGLQFDFDYRVAGQLQKLNQLESHRAIIGGAQSWENDYLKFRGSFRAKTESTYGAQPTRYGQELSRTASSEADLRDLYIQATGGPFILKLGYQQVVWGEAFGFFYADVVNPKDLREGGLGKLQDNRLTLPIASLSIGGSGVSSQFIANFKPTVSRHPEATSSFDTWHRNLPSSSTVAPANLKHSRTEFGARLGVVVGSFDFNVFQFEGIDRDPTYRFREFDFSNPLSPSPIFEAQHLRFKTTGFTATADADWALLRTEIVHRGHRPIQGFTNVPVIIMGSQATGVFGADFPQFGANQVGLQYSVDTIYPEGTDAILARRKTTDLLSVRWSSDPGLKNRIELMSALSTSDKGNLHQIKLTRSFGNRVELDVGVDEFEGPSTSQMGSLRGASRAYIEFRLTEVL